jgi:hypothetical protein
MATTIDQDIAELEKLLVTLKTKYDQFFRGEWEKARRSQELRALEDVESQLQSVIRTQAGRSISNPSARFRFNSVVARYNSLKPLWARKRREVEEGKVIIPFTTGHPMTPVNEGPPQRTPSPGAERAHPMPPRAVASAILSSGDPDSGSVRRLYDAYVGALGPEGAAKVPYQAFESQIRNQVSRHLTEGAAGIKFQVVEAEGKVRITSKPLRASRSEG